MLDLLRANPALWNRFTGSEEYEPPFTDEYGRFPHYASNQADIMTPVVSKFLFDRGIRFEYPGGKRYAMCLTHDVDMVRTTIFGTAERAARAVRNHDFRRLGEAASQLLGRFDKRSDPYRNFSEVIDMEDKFGARSSFFFLARRFWDGGWTYNIEELKDELRNIANAGWEVGLHGSPQSVEDLGALQEERRRLETCLGRSVAGYRSHFLRFKLPNTWENLAKTGFEYDTTYGTPYCVGFRNGMCHPFRPYNVQTNRLVEILEIPLNIMDFSLARYMHVSEDAGWDITRELIETSKRLGGVVTVLWHNNYTDTFGKSFYRKILDYGSKTGAWMTSAQEISTWWRDQGNTDWENLSPR
jgi:peptidoglycan/xylan/chitin deacetylase (PgdA/CDA1 family)